MNFTCVPVSRALVASLIGKPYRPGGRGPAFFDCWGLVVEMYQKTYSIDLPKYPNADPHNVKFTSGEMEGFKGEDWEQIEEPVDGCIVAMGRSRVFHHVGVWVDIDGGLCVHACDGSQVMAHNKQQLNLLRFSKIAYFKWSKFSQ